MKKQLLGYLFNWSRFATLMVVFACTVMGQIRAEGGRAPKMSIEDIYLTYSAENVQLKEAFRQIGRQTDFYFSYDKNVVNESERISASLNNGSLGDLLRHISREANLKFKRIDENIFVSRNILPAQPADMVSEEIYLQQRTVTGRVTSADDNSGLPGVNVMIQGTTSGTVTDLDGNFRLEVPGDAAVLVFSSVGYITETVAVGNRSVIDLVLTPDITQLSEIVVIGYGTREKKDLTGAYSFMDSEKIEKSVAMTPQLAMQGQMPGVFVTTPSGNPQDRPNIQIRGVGTFVVNEPLYVIDGIPLKEYGSGYEGYTAGGDRAARTQDLRGPVNIFTMINPADIESITVLKDASAAAIYGVQAANGVILITTKRGKLGTPKVDVSIRGGVQNLPNRWDIMSDVREYVATYQEAYANNPVAEPLPGVFNPDSLNAVNFWERYMGNFPYVDWQAAFINQNAAVQDVSARIYGATEATNYFVSAGYSYTEGPLIANSMKRYSIASNVTSKVSKYVEAGLTYRAAYVESRDQSPNFGNAFSPHAWQPIYYADDMWAQYKPEGAKYGYATVVDSTTTPNPQHPDFGGTGDPLLTPRYLVGFNRAYGPETASNFIARTDPRLVDNHFNFIRNIGNAYIQVEPLKGLRIRGTYSVDWYLQKRMTWTSIDAVLFNETPGNPFAIGAGNSKGQYGERHLQNYNLVGEILAAYNRSFGDHNIDLTFNFMDQQWGFNGIAGGADQIDIDDPERRGIPDTDRFYNNVFTDRDRFALQGFMGRASYNYNSKYYLDVTVRRDGSSRFAPEYRWGTFPAAAAAWRISAEPFFSGINLVNDLKIRAGWGRLGNQETRPFAYLSTVGIEPAYSIGSGPGNALGLTQFGVRLPDFPTRDLSWETATTSNIGFDAILMRNRLNATVEYYHRKTEDILQNAALAASVGNEVNPVLNIATVVNQGIELALGWRDRIGQVEYYIDGNFTTVGNEVIEVWNDQPFNAPGGRVEKGFPLYYHHGFKVGGIFQTEEEIQNWQETYTDNQRNEALVRPGDFYFQDVHGRPNELEPYYSLTPDSIVDLNDRTFIGNSIAGHYYGINFGASWKGFDIGFSWQGIGDVQKWNGVFAANVSAAGRGNNLLVDVRNRWTPGNQHTWSEKNRFETLPRITNGDVAGNFRFSNAFLGNAGFMRLRNLTLGYTVPRETLDRMGFIDNLRVYIMGNNVATLTNWKGIDPENDNVPIPATWSLGLNVTF